MKSEKIIALHDYQNHSLSTLVYSTGKTTGHIAEVRLNNFGKKEIVVQLGPYFIPSDGIYQSYIVPEETTIRVPSESEVLISLHGYCTDAFSQPVPYGKNFADPSKWILPDSGLIGEKGFDPEFYQGEIPISSNAKWSDWVQENKSDGRKIIVTNHLDSHSRNVIFESEMDESNHFNVLDSAINIEISILHLDPESHPQITATLYYDAIIKIMEAVEETPNTEWSESPFLYTLESQTHSIIQHTLWIYTSFSVGKIYSAEDFRNNLERQFSQTTGMDIKSTSAEVKREFEKGILDLWENFIQLGERGQIFMR